MNWGLVYNPRPSTYTLQAINTAGDVHHIEVNARCGADAIRATLGGGYRLCSILSIKENP